MSDYKDKDELTKTEDKAADNKKDDHKEYEDICYVCRRPESKAGKMIHLPINNICVCSDCMQKSFDTMNNSGMNYQDMMNLNNINFQDLFGFGMPVMGGPDSVPKSQKLKKKKPKEDGQPALDIKKIPAPHVIKLSLIHI